MTFFSAQLFYTAWHAIFFLIVLAWGPVQIMAILLFIRDIKVAQPQQTISNFSHLYIR